MSTQPNNSTILEQNKLERTPFNSLFVELFDDGRAKFHIPINTFNFDFSKQPNPIHNFDILNSDISTEVLQYLWNSDKAAHHSNVSCLKFFNVSEVFGVTISLMTFYKEKIAVKQNIGEIRFASELKNVWRTVPFFDSDEWGEHFRNFGLPVMKQNKICIPENTNRVFLPKRDKFFYLTPVVYIGSAFGLTANIIELAYKAYYLKFFEGMLEEQENL